MNDQRQPDDSPDELLAQMRAAGLSELAKSLGALFREFMAAGFERAEAMELIYMAYGRHLESAYGGDE